VARQLVRDGVLGGDAGECTLGAVPVGSDDIEVVRAFYDSFPERVRDGRAGVFEPHYARFYTDDHVMEMPDAFPSPGSFTGLEGYRTWFDEAYGPWEDVVWELEQIDRVGHAVVTRALIRGRPAGDTVTLEVRVGIVYDLRDGRICRTRSYLSHDRALEAARADA
jgi:ketosteroid isomerase-like protein